MAELTMPITGGCQCGAVRYQSDGPPTDTNYCHCRVCRRISGAPVVAFIEFAEQSFRFTEGAPKFFQTSSFAERGFCANCGSSLIYRPLEADGSSAVYIYSGTLDRQEEAPPKWHTGIESQVPWLVIDDDLPRMRTDENPDVAALKEATEQDET